MCSISDQNGNKYWEKTKEKWRENGMKTNLFHGETNADNYLHDSGDVH